MLVLNDTIAALATPVGISAIAMLRVTGSDTSALAAELAGSPPPPRVARHCDYRTRDGVLLDDVVVTFFKGPRSYTGEDSLEISCHGNPFIAQKILEDLFSRGCRPAQPGEFTQRAFLNGRLDLSQAEAVMDLINARSERALVAANQQLRGALGRRMEVLIDQLLCVLARVEAYIDFPDEDLPPEDREFIATQLAELLVETNRLLATSQFGHILRDGIKTVIIGAPNVGKSSLLNRLVGSERALVSPEPGTTRDFIEERVMIGPHCFRLIDTAGLNPSPAPIERLGIDKTYERLGEADLALLVLDVCQEFVPPPEVRGMSNLVIALNKSDLECRNGGDDLFKSLPAPFVRVSALTGAGMEELTRLLRRQVDIRLAASGDEPIAISARHAEALTAACEALQESKQKVRSLAPVELLASDLRTALASYGEITGKVDNDRMLDQLFAAFCIGK